MYNYLNKAFFDAIYHYKSQEIFPKLKTSKNAHYLTFSL